MSLNDDAQIDTDQISDQRSAGGGGLAGLPIPIGGRGGLIGTIVTIVIGLLVGGGFGVNALTNDDESGSSLGEACSTANPDRLQRTDCRNALYVNSIQDYWADALPQTFGKPYQQAKTVFFAQAVNTGCGAADSGVGPFYCPPDHLS